MPAAIDPTLDPARLPHHIGIVMDGESRWTARHRATAEAAQVEGLRAAWRIILSVRHLGISFLSLYPVPGFPADDSGDRGTVFLGAVRRHLAKEGQTWRQEGIRIVHSGELSDLNADGRRAMELLEESTRSGKALQVNIALRGGGRGEIVRAANRWLSESRQAGGTPAGAESGGTITEELLDSHLDLPHFPEPDLIVRTGGERRVSNFLLWESAYSEFVFSEPLWPDWSRADLAEAIAEYQRRTRRFGGA